MLEDGELMWNVGRYQTRLFSRKWLESKKLYEAIPEHLRKYVVLA